MKLLKGTIAAFAVTALLSSVGVNAESIWHFQDLLWKDIVGFIIQVHT